MNHKLFVPIATLLMLALAACAPAVAPTTAPPTSAPPAATATTAPTAVSAVKLNVAYSTLNPDPIPLWVAQDQGFFKQNGLDVTVIFVDGGTKTAQALIAKDVQFGVVAPSSAVNATAGGADLVLIAGLVNVINYDLITQPGIKTAADMKGKKVAWSGPSGSSATALRIALRTLFNLDVDKDVVAITIGTEPEREAAMVAKQIDATVINPDLAVKSQKDGLLVFDELWKRTEIPYQHTGIVASQAYLKANADTTNRFFRSIIQAIGFIRNPANKAQVIASLSKYLKLDDQDVLNSGYTRMSQSLLQCAPYATIEGMKTIVGESKPAQEKGLTAEKMTDNSFIKALDDGGFIKANCK